MDLILHQLNRPEWHLRKALKEVPSVKSSAVFYDRAVGAPYIEIKLNREAMARYGMSISRCSGNIAGCGRRNVA